MSTRQFQHYEDSVKEFNAAEEKMKAARKQFIDHARTTGVDLRKVHILDQHRDSIASIATRTQEYIGDNPDDVLVLAMEVEISSGRGHHLDQFKVQEIKDSLYRAGWKIVQTYDDNLGRGNFIREKHFLICI
ncbi:hypothetical protein D3C73_1324600 [compost metagenome]